MHADLQSSKPFPTDKLDHFLKRASLAIYPMIARVFQGPVLAPTLFPLTNYYVDGRTLHAAFESTKPFPTDELDHLLKHASLALYPMIARVLEGTVI